MFTDRWEREVVAMTIVIITFLLYLLAQRRSTALRKNEVPAFLSSPRRLSKSDRRNSQVDQVTIFLDGAYDMTHYGHMNAFRQARALGTRLVVGVNSDASILRHKGPPIMKSDERCEVVGACRFVDEIVRDVPYVLTMDDVEEIMEKYDIDYFVHGDDPCTVDGKDVYSHVKALGKFQYIPRTEGISTTDIIGRIVNLTCNVSAVDGAARLSPINHDKVGYALPTDTEISSTARTFYPTCRMIRCFGGAVSAAPPTSDDDVVYIAGDWDVFNASHVDVLKKSKSLGTYVLVGVYSDEVLRQYIGGRPPILNVYERVLAVLACKYVDDVVFADMCVNQEMIDSFRIKKVLRMNDDRAPDEAYAIPQKLGILETLTRSAELITPEVVAGRIFENWDAVTAKQKAKAQKEKDFYDQKYQ